MKNCHSSNRPTKKRLFTKLKELYYDTKDSGSYGGVERLFQSAKQNGLKINRKGVERFLKTQDVYTLHKPVKKKFQRNPIIVGDIDQQWQADLADVSDISRENKGYNFLLTVIDCFSKYAWVIPTKRKDAKSMVAAFQELLKQSNPRKPKRLQTDQGKEFINKDVQAFLKTNEIQYFYSLSDLKAAMVERFNRTLKSRMWRYFTNQGNHRYIEVLDDLVKSYNNSIHRTIGMAPTDVKHENVERLWYKMFGKLACSGLNLKKSIRNEEPVRIPTYKMAWDKGYTPNWTSEVFRIKNPVHHSRKVYKLEDFSKETIAGSYYPEEIQPVDISDNHSYEVDKVIKKRTIKGGAKEFFVKWKGWSEKFNSWVAEEQFDK